MKPRANNMIPRNINPVRNANDFSANTIGSIGKKFPIAHNKQNNPISSNNHMQVKLSKVKSKKPTTVNAVGAFLPTTMRSHGYDSLLSTVYLKTI